MAQIEIDNVFKCHGQFTVLEDTTINNVVFLAGAFADPIVVQVEIQPPTGPKVTWIYGAQGSTIVKDAVGRYHVPILFDQAELWLVTWKGSGLGSIVASGSGGVSVNDRPFP